MTSCLVFTEFSLILRRHANCIVFIAQKQDGTFCPLTHGAQDKRTQAYITNTCG